MTMQALESISKYLLCRPRGGLNDVLCQIEKCWRYAEKHRRILVIDTRDSGLMGSFFEYFSVKESSVPVRDFFSLNEIRAINQEKCLPKFCSGRLDILDAYFLDPEKNYVDRASNESITFDFEVDHAETLLVHEQSGGGTLSFACLNRLYVAEPVRQQVLLAMKKLPKIYSAIHIRNTDYQSNYKYYFSKLAKRFIGRPVLVCSDDDGVIKYAKSFFQGANIMTLSDRENIDGKPLHLTSSYENERDRKAATISAITDLLALGGSKFFYYMGGEHGHPSGYSVLAAHLCNNKSLINSLLKRDLNFCSDLSKPKAIFLLPTQDRFMKMVPKFMRPRLKWIIKSTNKFIN